jgi:hypothetical protein
MDIDPLSFLVAGLAGSVVALTLREVVDWLKGPRLRIEFGKGDPFLVKRHSIDEKYWLRIRIKNIGRKTAKNVKVYISALSIEGENKNLVDNPAELGFVGNEKSSQANLPPGIRFFVDAFVQQGKNSCPGAVVRNPPDNQLAVTVFDLYTNNKEFSIEVTACADDAYTISEKVSLDLESRPMQWKT